MEFCRKIHFCIFWRICSYQTEWEVNPSSSTHFTYLAFNKPATLNGFPQFCESDNGSKGILMNVNANNLENTAKNERRKTSGKHSNMREN